MGVQFPELMEDLSLPVFFDEDKFFSSVLRVGSPGVRLWTHYDVSRIAGQSGWNGPCLLCECGWCVHVWLVYRCELLVCVCCVSVCVCVLSVSLFVCLNAWCACCELFVCVCCVCS